MALDLPGGKIYWTDDGSRDIRRANLDGSSQEILVIDLSSPRGISLDLPGGKMYWVVRDTGDIRRANLDGSGQEILARERGRQADRRQSRRGQAHRDQARRHRTGRPDRADARPVPGTG